MKKTQVARVLGYVTGMVIQQLCCRMNTGSRRIESFDPVYLLVFC